MKKLYLSRMAPNPRKIIILMQSKGIDIDDMTDIDVIDIDLLKGEQQSEEFAKINPLKKVPVLVLNDGTVLNDSQAICEYLDRVYGERSVMGNDVVQRAKVCSMRRIAEFDVMYNFMLAFQHGHPANAKRLKQIPEFAEQSIQKIIDVLPYFENVLQENEYLVSNQFSYADIVFYIALDFGKVMNFDPTEHGEGIARFYNMMNEKYGLKKV